MIRYFFKKKENHNIIMVEVLGHALYAPKGFDIVCASVSTAIIVSLNALEMLGYQKDISFSYLLEDNFFHLDVLNFDEKKIFLLLSNLEYTLDNLRNQYPNHLKKEKGD
ncbi:ribosomal-processing cysteine protease Prp [Candidatus Phytoplasma solani]|uniref:ribosomal-processing cysteine protease Prp n=1 Tax=Candidatus Phytoplasma solani TaxID=69896 RepID=UPI0032DB89A5